MIIRSTGILSLLPILSDQSLGISSNRHEKRVEILRVRMNVHCLFFLIKDCIAIYFQGNH